jgi:hypothetical protein
MVQRGYNKTASWNPFSKRLQGCTVFNGTRQVSMIASVRLHVRLLVGNCIFYNCLRICHVKVNRRRVVCFTQDHVFWHTLGYTDNGTESFLSTLARSCCLQRSNITVFHAVWWLHRRLCTVIFNFFFLISICVWETTEAKNTAMRVRNSSPCQRRQIRLSPQGILINTVLDNVKTGAFRLAATTLVSK